MEALRLLLTAHGLNEPDAATVVQAFVPRSLTRGEHFVEAGQISPLLGFVEVGIFQYYHLLPNGTELTTYVTSEGSFIVSLGSFLRQAPALECIRAITSASVGVITRPAFDALRQRLPALEAFYLGLLEYQIVCIDQSRTALITQSAEERYQALLRDEPHLLQRVPLHYLASVLGITPRHLSRIRRQLT